MPTLTDWGFVVLSSEESESVSAEDESAAKETVATLRERVENAKEAGHDWSPTFTVAKTRLEEATTALESEAYSEALEKAEKGVSVAEELGQEQPVVGIDFAHGVTFNEDDEESEGGPLESLQNNIAYPEYRVIESWSNEVLGELDVLIIPPALSFRSESFDFAFDTRQAIEEWVEEGGRLVILARGGIASDINQLIGNFDYMFDGRGIKAPEDQDVTAPVVTDHELTLGVPEIGASLGTTISELPEHATSLAAVPEDNDFWFHEEAPLNERNESEEDVPPEPVYAVSNHGDGTVALLGSWSYLLEGNPLDFWTPVMNNLIYTLSTGQAVAEAPATPTATPTATPSPTSKDNTATTAETGSETQATSETTTESPGFGLLGGLAGISGVAALAHRWRNNDDQDS